MHAHKLKVTVREDHRVEVRLPDDFPEGPAEAIILAHASAGDPQQQALAALAELRSLQLTSEEEQILDEFESFRRDNPLRFSA